MRRLSIGNGCHVHNRTDICPQNRHDRMTHAHVPSAARLGQMSRQRLTPGCKVLGTVGERDSYGAGIILSPDNTRLAVTRTRDIWIIELARGVSHRLTFDPRTDESQTALQATSARDVLGRDVRWSAVHDSVTASESIGEPYKVILNWTATLRRRAS
jgi:hypothetical protein